MTQQRNGYREWSSLCWQHREVEMELDTGAPNTTLYLNTCYKLCSSEKRPKLHHTTSRLRAYGGHNIKVLGSIQVTVETKAGQEPKNVFMLVVEGKGSNLLGRDLLSSLRMDWKRVCRVWNPFDEVLARYPEVFSEGLGMSKEKPAKIHVEVSVKPRFCKARSLP